MLRRIIDRDGQLLSNFILLAISSYCFYTFLLLFHHMLSGQFYAGVSSFILKHIKVLIKLKVKCFSKLCKPSFDCNW